MNTIIESNLEQKKHDLRRSMEWLNIDQLEMIDEIIKAFAHDGMRKGIFTDMAMKGNETNYDCALPLSLKRDAEDLGITLENFFNVATYRSENHNCMKIENTAELFVNRLVKAFRIQSQFLM